MLGPVIVSHSHLEYRSGNDRHRSCEIAPVQLAGKLLRRPASPER
jgi:hypothetical protein